MSAPVSNSELRVLPALKKATDLSIRFDPRTIELVPNTRVQKPGGVYDNEAQTPRAPQTFNVIPISSTLGGRSGSVDRTVESDGVKGHSWFFYLVGRHDAEMAIGDTWKDGTTDYRIISLMPKNDYERRAVVEAFGKDPNYGN
ncbi:hypothetical protein HWB51_gp012 [Mycobacterium phage Cuke]|uniref:Head-to-tail stopper n=1 Tax=Mycobacterium phage Cuke TaxID=2079417 RepID=A0A2L1IWP5_9CAUD|nr:hypothetical protein HWB51_gp012 [Mycobacterium phage Cuke]AVD99630.1 hypothetical protein SEA_CUKE_12 [Mycobacterium phage Cuke]